MNSVPGVSKFLLALGCALVWAPEASSAESTVGSAYADASDALPVAKGPAAGGERWTALAGVANGCNGAVEAILAGPSGEFYLGGHFTQCGGVNANHIVRYDPRSGAWTPLGSGGGNGLDTWVQAMAFVGNDLYVGGLFTQANAGAGITANRIARWDGSSWSALGSGAGNGTSGSVYSLAVSGGNLYVGGDFQQANVGAPISANGVARWDGTNWSALGSGGGNGVNERVRVLTMFGGDLYVGGFFTAANSGANIAANRIARWNGTTWSALGSGGGNGVNDFVHAFAVLGGELYVGGNFTQVNLGAAVTATRVARWDGSVWSALGNGGGVNGHVLALTFLGNDLYAGGVFTEANDGVAVPATYIARWNGSTWSTLGSGVNGQRVSAIAAGVSLMVGGVFSTAGGQTASNIARYSVPRDVDSLTPDTTEPSLQASVSGSGRFVVFESLDPKPHAPCAGVPNPPRLCGVGGDACPVAGPLYVYRADTTLGCVDLVSTDQAGAVIKMIPHQLGKGGGEEPLGKPSPSADGTEVAFVADSAVVGKLWGESKSAREQRQKGGGLSVLMRNMLTGTTRQIGTGIMTGTDPVSGQPINGSRPQVAADGSAVVYTGLVGGKPAVMQAQFNGMGGIDTFCVSCASSTGAQQGAPGSFTEPLDGFAHNATVSANGALVAYQTVAKNAAPSACNNGANNSAIILRNMLTGTSRTISQPQGTGCQLGSAGKPSMDFSGTQIVFESTQPLAAGATARPEVYLFNVRTNVLSQISVNGDSSQVDAGSGEPAISGDGRLIAFTSRSRVGFGATLPGGAPDVSHIVVRELRGNTIQRLSQNNGGVEANGDSFRPTLSYSGDAIVFDSVASNLSGADSNGAVSDVFLRTNPAVINVVFDSGFE